MTKYLITVKAIKGYILSFRVTQYTVENGLVSFVDMRNNCEKHFPVQDCNIEEVEE